MAEPGTEPAEELSDDDLDMVTGGSGTSGGYVPGTFGVGGLGGNGGNGGAGGHGS